mmetsp:Transcript_11682/g.49173  ORF Transcript_11682/g.49173 Transcript_11682/m.49173 type:complete len:83 (-) Transcript_11682:44-292(-)
MPTQDEMRVKLQMDAYTAVCKAMYAMDEGSVKGGEVLGMLRGGAVRKGVGDGGRCHADPGRNARQVADGRLHGCVQGDVRNG